MPTPEIPKRTVERYIADIAEQIRREQGYRIDSIELQWSSAVTVTVVKCHTTRILAP